VSLPDKPVPLLLGVTPPIKRSPPKRREEVMAQTIQLARSLGDELDGLVVYDVWEGNERGRFRNKYGDNRPFAVRLRDATGKAPIVCNVVVHQGPDVFRRWVDEAVKEQLVDQVYVGASTERFPVKGPGTREAFIYVSNRYHGLVKTGSITIPWRHQEAKRLARKVEAGASFAISQIMLEPRSGIELVNDLDKLCAVNDLAPPRIFWNVAPVVDVEVAREDFDYFEVFPPPEHPAAHELALRNWLRIAQARNPLEESIRVACENVEQLVAHTMKTKVKCGITAEGLGAQNLPYLESLLRGLADVRRKALAGIGR
jgi:hypothetical protein